MTHFIKMMQIGVLLWVLPLFVYSQQADTLKICLKDSASGLPASGIVFTVKDARTFSKQVNTFYDACGTVILPAGYQLPITIKVTDKTYKPLNHTVSYIPKDTLIIILSANEYYKQMEEAKVSAVKRAVKEDARGASLDISKLKNADKISLADALLMIPGLEIDLQNSSITYLGNPVTIQKDGISVAGFDNIVKNTLHTARANMYKKVNINLYDLKTENATISFEEPQYEDGILSSINGSTGMSRTSLSNSTNIYFKKQIFTIAPDIAINYSAKSGLMREVDYINTGIKTKMQSNSPGSFNKSGVISLGYNVDISPKNTIDLSFRYSSDEAKHKNSIIQQSYLNNVLNDELRTNSETDNPFNLIMANAAFIHKFKRGKLSTRRLDIGTNYMGSYRLLNIITRSNTTIGNMIPGSNNDNISNSSAANLQSHVSYEYRHQKLGGFEFVAKYFYRTVDNTSDIRFYDFTPTDSLLQQQSSVRYHYSALLASWDKSFKPFSVRIVLKQDYSVDKVVTAAHDRPRLNYSTFAPYISLQKALKNGNSLRMESRYQSYRPNLETLTQLTNPTGRFSETGSVLKSNPNLKPSTVLNINANYTSTIKKKHSIIYGSTFSHIYNPIQQYTALEDGIKVISTKNIGSSDELKFFINSGLNLFTRFTWGIAPSYTFRRFNDSSTVPIKTTHSYGISSTINYGLTPYIKVTVTGSYDKRATYQVVYRPIFRSTFFLSYAKNNFSTNLFIMNWHQFKFKTNTTTETVTDNFIERAVSNSSQRLNISLAFSYKLGKPFKRKSATNRKEIIRDDM